MYENFRQLFPIKGISCILRHSVIAVSSMLHQSLQEGAFVPAASIASHTVNPSHSTKKFFTPCGKLTMTCYGETDHTSESHHSVENGNSRSSEPTAENEGLEPTEVSKLASGETLERLREAVEECCDESEDEQDWVWLILRVYCDDTLIWSVHSKVVFICICRKNQNIRLITNLYWLPFFTLQF